MALLDVTPEVVVKAHVYSPPTLHSNKGLVITLYHDNKIIGHYHSDGIFKPVYPEEYSIITSHEGEEFGNYTVLTIFKKV